MREVARRAHISLASLSRIETNQQGLEMGLFLHLAKILDAEPADLLPGDGAAGDEIDPVIRRIGVLSAEERLLLWRRLADSARSKRERRRAAAHHLAQEVEELMAQVEFLYAEVEAVRARLRLRKPAARRGGAEGPGEPT